MEADSKDGFVRQRRNLMVMSLVVFFTYFSELKFKTINVFGNRADIGNYESVYLFLWAVLVYWLIRYFQYFMSHDGSDIFPYFSYQRYSVFADRAHILARKSNRRQFALETAPPDNRLFFVNVNGDRKGTQRNHEAHEYNDYWFFSGNFNFKHRSGLKGQRITLQGASYKIALRDSDLLYINLVSFGRVVTRSIYFSEFILPFVLFLLPVGYYFHIH